MALELYWGSGSTPAWRVLLALTYKELPFTSNLLSFSKRETRTPAFLAMNPRGKVPTLVHDGVVLNESLAILAYLDRAYPEKPLFGATPAEAGQIWRLVMEFESHGGPAISAVSRPILFGKPEEEAEKIREALPALEAELDMLEQRTGGGFLVGGALSAADIVWYCGLAQLQRALTRPAGVALDLGIRPIGVRWPGVLRWARLVEAIPGFDATIPPHWLEGENPTPARLS